MLSAGKASTPPQLGRHTGAPAAALARVAVCLVLCLVCHCTLRVSAEEVSASSINIAPRSQWRIQTIATNSDWDLVGSTFIKATNRLYVATSPTGSGKYKGLMTYRFHSKLFYQNGADVNSRVKGGDEYQCTFSRTMSTSSTMFSRIDGLSQAPTGSGASEGIVYGDSSQVQQFEFPADTLSCSNCGSVIAGQYTDCSINAGGVADGTVATNTFLPLLRAVVMRESTNTLYFTTMLGHVMGTVDIGANRLNLFSGSNTAPTSFDASTDYPMKVSSSARMSNAYKLAITSDQYMFYTDLSWGLLGMFDLASDQHSTITGDGTPAQAACSTSCAPGTGFPLYEPTAIAVYDFLTAPMVFVGERRAFQIRVYYMGLGLFATAAGTGVASATQEDGRALDSPLDEARDFALSDLGLFIVEPQAIRVLLLRIPVTPTRTFSNTVIIPRTPSLTLTVPPPPTRTQTDSVTKLATETIQPPETPTKQLTVTREISKSPSLPRERTATEPIPTPAPPTNATTSTDAPTTDTPTPTTATDAATTTIVTSNDTTTTAAGTPTTPAMTSEVPTPSTNGTAPTDVVTSDPPVSDGNTTEPPITSPPNTTDAPPTPAPTLPPRYVCGRPRLHVAVGKWSSTADVTQSRPEFDSGGLVTSTTVASSAWAIVVTSSVPAYTPSAVVPETPPPSSTSSVPVSSAGNDTAATTTQQIIEVEPELFDVAALRLEFGSDTVSGTLDAFYSGDLAPRSSAVSIVDVSAPNGRTTGAAFFLAVARDFLPETDAVVAVIAPPAAFTCRLPGGGSDTPTSDTRVTVIIEASTDLSTERLSKSVATAGVAASAALNPAAATGPQASVMLGLMSCSSNEQRAAADVRLLSPLMRPGDRPAWMAASNAMLLGSYFVVLGLAVLFASSVECIASRLAGEDAGKVMLEHKCARWEIIAAKLHFPSSIFTLGQFMLQGLAFGSTSAIFAEDATSADVVYIAAGVIACIALPFMYIVVHTMQSRRLSFVPVELRGTVPTPWRSFIPENTWSPDVPRRMFAFALSQWRLTGERPESKRQLLTAMHHIVGLTVTSVGMGIPTSTSLCAPQAAIVSAIFFVWAGGIIKVRPYRRVFYNVTFAGSYVCNGVLFAAGAAALQDPGNSTATSIQLVAQFAQLGFSVAALIYTGIWVLLELVFLMNLWTFVRDGLAQLRQRFALKRPQRDTSPSLDGGDDDELRAGAIDSVGEGTSLEGAEDGDSGDADADLEAHDDLVRALMRGRSKAVAPAVLEQWGASPAMGIGVGDADTAAAARVAPSELARAIGSADGSIPEGVKVYRGERLNPDGSVASPTRPAKKKAVHIALATDLDTASLPPRPLPQEPMTSNEAARLLGLEQLPPPPPPLPPKAQPAESAAPPPPPPADELSFLDSPFDAHVSLAQLATTAGDAVAERCATIAALTQSPIGSVIHAAALTAKQRHTGALPSTMAELAAAIAGVVDTTAANLDRPCWPTLASISSPDAQDAFHVLASETGQTVEHIFDQALKRCLHGRVVNAARTPLDDTVSASDVALEVAGMLAEHRAHQRPTADASLSRGISVEEAARHSLTRNQNPLASAGMNAAGGSSMILRPVSMQQAALPFRGHGDGASPDYAGSPDSSGSRSSAERRYDGSRGGGARDLPGAPSSSSGLPTSAPSRYFNPYRTSMPSDSALPPTTYDRDVAGQAAQAVRALVERKYEDDRRKLHSALREEEERAQVEREARARARRERRLEKEQRIARLVAAQRAAEERSRPRRLRRDLDSDEEDLLKYL